MGDQPVSWSVSASFFQFEWIVHPVVRLTDPPVCQPTTPGCHDYICTRERLTSIVLNILFLPDSAIAGMEMLCSTFNFQIKLLK